LFTYTALYRSHYQAVLNLTVLQYSSMWAARVASSIRGTRRWAEKTMPQQVLVSLCPAAALIFLASPSGSHVVERLPALAGHPSRLYMGRDWFLPVYPVKARNCPFTRAEALPWSARNCRYFPGSAPRSAEPVGRRLRRA